MANPTSDDLTVFWQPGCSSCLNVKEYLSRHGVAFHSVNVLEDAAGLSRLRALGVRQVPVVARGTTWVDGQALDRVAELAGLALSRDRMLDPDELVKRIDGILSLTGTYASLIPETEYETRLPHRPRTYSGLACHIFEIVEAYLDLVEHEKRVEFEVYDHPVPPALRQRDSLLAFGADVRARLQDWWQHKAEAVDLTAPADVYFGDVTLHQFLERSAWHAGQHLRQLERVLVEKLSIQPDRLLSDRDFDGLPMPRKVWDDQLAF